MPADTKAAINRQVYAGVFEVRVGAEGVVDHIELFGEGWTAVEVEIPPLEARMRQGILRIPFRAFPQDASKPLEVSVTWNGRRASRSFVLSQEKFARRGRSYPAVQLGVDPQKEITPAVRGGVENKVKAASDVPIASPAAEPIASGGTELRVTGRIVYTRPDGMAVGLDHIWVQVKDDDDVIEDLDDTIWEGYTDENGWFDTGNYIWDDPGGPDVYVRWECDTNIVNVQDGDDVLEADWSWSTEDTNLHFEDWQGGDIEFGRLTAADSGLMPAMHIHNSIVRSHRFVQNRSGIHLAEFDVVWPEGNNASYSCFDEQMEVSVGRQWNEATHAHEFGHHFECIAANPNKITDYCNDTCDSEDDCGHCLWCDENVEDAWHEGFPHWLADVVTRSFELDYLDLDGCPYRPLNFRDMETPDECQNDCGCSSAGEFTPALITEGFISALLRDMEDDEQDDHDDDGIGDCMALAAGPILTAVSVIEPETLREFIDGFIVLNPARWDAFWKTAFNVDPSFATGFPADAEPPDAVTQVWSPTHPKGTGGPLPCITVEWNPADDDVSGAASYSFVWSQTPDPELEPDFNERAFARCVGSAPSPPVMPGGQLYIRLRARDAVGNWGPASEWFGPFVVTLDECSASANGVPDVCDAYCNLDDAPVACQQPIIFNYCGSFGSCDTAEDCNENAIPDGCDIADGTSPDCDEDGVPDECQSMRHWINLGSGSWHVPANWDTKVAPPPAPCSAVYVSEDPGTPLSFEDVCINKGTDVTVEYFSNMSSINSVFCQDNLLVRGGTLTVDQPSFVRRDLTVSHSGVMNIPSPTTTFDVSGMLRMGGTNSTGGAGTLSGAGTTLARDGMEINFVPTLKNGHTLENFGVGTVIGGFSLQSGSKLINRTGALIDKQHGYYYAFTPDTGIFINEGTFIKSGADEAAISVKLENHGLIHVQLGGMVINPLFNGGSTNTGAYLGNVGTTLYFQGGNHYFSPESTILADTVHFDNPSSGVVDIEGTYNVFTRTSIRSNTAVTFTADANVVSYGAHLHVEGIANFNAAFNGPIHFESITVRSATAAFNSGDPVNTVTLNVGNSGGTVRGPSPITVSGLLTWSPAGHFFDPGEVNANGGLHVPAGTSVRSLHERTLNNAGPAIFLAATSLLSNSAFHNLASGSVDIQADGTIFAGGIGPVITNAGTWRKTAGAGQSRIECSFTNTGTVEVEVGDLRFQNATFTQTAGSTLLTGGSLSAVTQGNTAIGTLAFLGGGLSGNGSISAHVSNIAATVSPGLSAGTLNITGNYHQGVGGILEMELGGPEQGTDYDWLNVSGTATLSGTLDVAFINGFAPAIGEQFVVLTAGNVTGEFDPVTPPNADVRIEVIYGPTTVTLEIAPNVVLGDCNQDFDVDITDFGTIGPCVHGPGAGLLINCACADVDGDSDVDLVDVARVQLLFSE